MAKLPASVIWLPDGEAARVEWYVSGQRAVGVQSITDDWVPREVGPGKGRVGFVEPDVPRDDLIVPQGLDRHRG